MVKIAIVEDERAYQEQFFAYVKKYEAESGERMEISIFSDGYEIVEKYNASYDIIFLDIQLVVMDGMETAKKIRKLDENVILIFITNMAQYAIQGYEVNALDYVLKPVSYFAFSQELDKAVKKIKLRKGNSLLLLPDKGVYTEKGNYTFRKTMKEMEKKLDKDGFVRCNSGYLVNLRYVEEVNENIVTVAGEKLQISRPRKKIFMEALTDYLGGK